MKPAPPVTRILLVTLPSRDRLEAYVERGQRRKPVLLGSHRSSLVARRAPVPREANADAPELVGRRRGLAAGTQGDKEEGKEEAHGRSGGIVRLINGRCNTSPQRSSLRIMSFSPDQVSSTAHTFMSTSPVGSTTSLMMSSVMSVATPELFFGQDTQTTPLGAIVLR